MTRTLTARFRLAALLGLVVGCGRTNVPVPAGAQFNVFAVIGVARDQKTSALAFSRDGTEWTPVRFPVVLTAVASGGHRAVAIAEEGQIFSSEDLENWTPTVAPDSDHLYGVFFLADRFVAVAGKPPDFGVRLLESLDGVTWRPSATPVPFAWLSRAAPDATGKLWASTSEELFTFEVSRGWVKREDKRIVEATFAQGELLVVAWDPIDKEHIERTSDGAAWTRIRIPPRPPGLEDYWVTRTRDFVVLEVYNWGDWPVSPGSSSLWRFSEAGEPTALQGPTGSGPIRISGHDDTVIAAGHDALWASQDQGKSWGPQVTLPNFTGFVRQGPTYLR